MEKERGIKITKAYDEEKSDGIISNIMMRSLGFILQHRWTNPHGVKFVDNHYNHKLYETREVAQEVADKTSHGEIKYMVIEVFGEDY